MKVKTILISIFILSLAIKVSGQLTVDAGRDTALCYFQDSLRLGGNPTAIGGKEPYVYKWELKPFYYYNHRILASELLNDSTSANPYTIRNPYDIIAFDITLILTVTDANMDSKKDSVRIRVSNYFILLTLNIEAISQGDSAQIYPRNVLNGIPPFSYHWTPEIGLSNPNIFNPFASPDTTTLYFCHVTDAIGCNAKDNVIVLVYPTAALLTNDVKNKSVVYPNPIQKHSVIRFDSFNYKNLFIDVINVNGQIVFNDSFNTNSYEIGKKIDKNGIYFYRIKNKTKILTVGQFIKE